MKIFEFFKGLFARDKPKNEYRWSGSPFLFGSSLGGKSVDTTTALQLSAVFACVKILAESVACLPLHVYETDNKGNKELAIKHPLYYLLHDAPNSEMAAYNYKEIIMLHLLLYGNSYSQIVYKGGKIFGLYPLLPDKMTVKRDDSGKRIYTYTPSKGENDHFQKTSKVEYKAEDILHIPALGIDGLYGYSPISMAKNAIGVALACEEFGAKFFENGARPSGILKVPHVLIVNDAKSLCPVKSGTLRDSIKSKPNNDGSVYRISASAENNGFDYAPIIEYAPYGTPFMKPAYEANINRIYNNIRTSIRQATETGHA